MIRRGWGGGGQAKGIGGRAEEGGCGSLNGSKDILSQLIPRLKRSPAEFAHGTLFSCCLIPQSLGSDLLKTAPISIQQRAMARVGLPPHYDCIDIAWINLNDSPQPTRSLTSDQARS